MNKPEYLRNRCCMCPNVNAPENKICPPKPFNQENTDCRFIKTYIDNRGWLYRVMSGLGEGNFKARYRKPGKPGWKCTTNMTWRKSFDEAQSDLNNMARLKKWDEIQSD